MGKRCTRCISDETIPGIYFDNNGVCNYCHSYDITDKNYAINEENTRSFLKYIEKIKADGKGKEYDCIQGVSGGRDSTYCLYLLKQWGLNPLALHFDNNMDSKIAAENIKKACRKLDVDLYTYVVDWDEFKDLQRSFFSASVPSIDIPTDHAFVTVIYNHMCDNKIRYVSSGSSFRTEGAGHRSWSLHNDDRFILDIQKKFGSRTLKKFPIRRLTDLMRYRMHGLQRILPLYHMPYVHEEIEKIIKGELGWQYYGGHHFESILTRWSFAYLLPHKFGIDKRIIDYSALIRSGQISREDALLCMEEDFYPSSQERDDRRYIMSKLEFTAEEMDVILAAPPRSNFEYAHYSDNMMRIVNYLTPPVV